jgi:hypothetical protein
MRYGEIIDMDINGESIWDKRKLLDISVPTEEGVVTMRVIHSNRYELAYMRYSAVLDKPVFIRLQDIGVLR